MLIVIIRTLFLYLLVMISLRMMGKREIGQLQPFELVVVLMIADFAVIPGENMGIPLLSGIIPILVLLTTSLTLAWISLKSEKARSFINGKPSIIIERGKILEKELKENCYNLTDLLEELRLNGVSNIADVEYAILENNGQLSIFLKPEKRPAIPEDFKIKPAYEGLPITLITDGKLNTHRLKQANHTQNWLERELKKQSISKIEDVLLASLDSSGTLFVQAKQRPEI